MSNINGSGEQSGINAANNGTSLNTSGMTTAQAQTAQAAYDWAKNFGK